MHARIAKLRNALVDLSLVLAAALVAGLVGEAAIRLLPLRGFVDLPSNLFMPHPLLGRVLVPGHAPVEKKTSELSFRVQTNSDGLRDVEIGPKQPAERRVLVLGDSFTWGDGVDLEQTYVKRLEVLLNARCRRPGPARYRVIDAGVPEWGMAQMWLYLRDYGARFRPDVVLLGLFDLDVYRNGPYLRTVFDSMAEPEAAPSPSRLSLLKLWLRGHSRVYNLAAAYLVESPAVNEWLEKTGIRARKPREFLSAGSGYVDRVMAENARILTMMQDFTKRRGIGFAAAYIPTASEVEAVAGGKRAGDRVAPMMREVFRRDPESMVDLTPGLAAASRQRAVYYPWDGHWTAAGHRAAAALLLPIVSRLAGDC